MRAVHIISLIARVALMATLVLGLLFWIAQISFLSMLLNILVQIGFTSIHELFGLTGVLALLVLGTVAVFTGGDQAARSGEYGVCCHGACLWTDTVHDPCRQPALADPGGSPAGGDRSNGISTADR